MLKIKIHSIVDVITNSSTVIFTYQNSVKEAKELVAEVLRLAGEDKTPDDVFYYGVFCEDDQYLYSENLPEDCPDDPDYKTKGKLRREWLDKIKLDIITGEIEQPQWMSKCEEADKWSDWLPSSLLYLMPKDPKYEPLADKIKSLLGSVGADGGRDG